MYKKAGMSSPIERGPIRGMEYIPGGIPASEGFDYDKSLERFPEQMKGIERGNMPVFRTLLMKNNISYGEVMEVYSNLH